MAGGNLPFGLAPSGALTNYTPTLTERVTDAVRRYNPFFSDDRAGQQKAERVTQALQIPFGFATDMYDAGREAGRGNFGAAGMLGAMAIIPGSFPGNKLPSVDALARKADKFAYHSGTADNVADMQYGVEPQIGPWVEEVLSGSVDSDDLLAEIMENAVPVAWWSKTPTWVKAKVARKLNKPQSEVTEADIIEHGHLAMVPRKSDDADELYFVGKDGLNNGPYSELETAKGEKVKAYNTGLYQGNYGPEGVERNEYITPRSIEPYLQLTGPELLEFLQKSGGLSGRR
jgi:hypothetical protein